MANFPAINWLTSGEGYNDYRPAIGPDGTTAVFERSSAANPVTKLYQVTDFSKPDPQPFLPKFNEPQTRPDWCWKTNEIVFNNNSVWIVKGDGTGLKEVADTTGFSYPQWNADGTTITVANGNKASAHPNPCSTVINKAGKILHANINGTAANGLGVFGGMPAVNPTNPLQVAFAGQPVLPPWGKPLADTAYEQNNNYIFLNTLDNKQFSSAPMESKASIYVFDPAFQGRAPAWSPDGRYIVFESTRQWGRMALFLYDTVNGGDPVQLTNPLNLVQHAKFFPDGKKLILCGAPESGRKSGIGWIDIPGL